MKKLIAFIIALILLLVVLVVVVLSAPQARCETGNSAPGRALDVHEGVPDGEFSLPESNALAHVSSEFGPRWGTMHEGIDISQGYGTPIYAFYDGRVTHAGDAYGFGKWIVIDHVIDGQIVTTVYGHMYADGIHVSVGEAVKAGQHIADEGSNGHSTGPHLHFEVRPGGKPVDPRPWLEKAKEPGSVKASTKTVKNEKKKAPVKLEPHPKFPDEAKLMTNAIRVGRAGAHLFDESITIVGGWRPDGGAALDHVEGRAVDFMMIDNGETGESVKAGDEIVAYLLANKEDYDLDYLIWRQKLYPANGEPYMMEDRGTRTDNHYDHVHVSVHFGEFPKPGEEFYGGPNAAGSLPTSTQDDCIEESDPTYTADSDLSDSATEIPEDWKPYIIKSARQCRQITAPLLAGLLYQESGFQTSRTSVAGAYGPAQFMPGTWASAGAETDEEGNVVGPPGSGDANSPRDSIYAAGRYLCAIAKEQEPLIAKGTISGDPTQLMLAGYNAGTGNVVRYGGVPPFAETQKYVTAIPQHAKTFAGETNE